MSRKSRIYDALKEAIEPELLQVEDESHRHHVPPNAESHFRITAVSKEFETLSRVHRHRKIHTLLNEEFNKGLHALSLHLYTPTEWLDRSKEVPDSPMCRNGKQHE